MSEALKLRKPPPSDASMHDEMATHLLAEESRLVASLVDRAAPSAEERTRIGALAARLAGEARAARHQHGGIDAFMHEYAFSSEEGVILMCLAEALLRIPDRATADALIADRMAEGDWDRHLGASDSLMVNASTWGLMLSGKLAALGSEPGHTASALLKRMVARSGKPVIREALRQAMRLMGDQFVMAPSIRLALGRAEAWEAKGYRMSYDMLGEAARTAKDAQRNRDRYLEAIEAVGQAAGKTRDSGIEGLMARPGLSLKLSALHARFEPAQEVAVRRSLVPMLVEMGRLAKRHGLSLTIDAEEQERLELTLAVLAEVAAADSLAEWNGLGIAVQAYGKRAIPVLRMLRRLARETRRRLPVRLVKGAYWDSEIKWAQERGLADYPVLTRKAHTDVSFLACMRFLLTEGEAFYPQLATHNAHTLAAAHVTAAWSPFELQRLHGMGEALYGALLADPKLARPCRIYAPVGGHDDLLPYLVRRLLENGANTSFINRLADHEVPVEEIVRDPLEVVETAPASLAPPIPRPADLFRPERRNSAGIALWAPSHREPLLAEMRAALATPAVAAPIVAGRARTGEGEIAVLSPHDRRVQLGRVREAAEVDIEEAIVRAGAAQRGWDRLGGSDRGAILLKAADLMESERARLMALIVREAGRTLDCALSEVREGVDYLRYYASEARAFFGEGVELRGVTGERNRLALHGRGTFACISPWNFPLAIFIGQVAAALAAGNSVLAKPAEQTPLTAVAAIELLHRAGVPGDVLHLLPGTGEAVGERLVRDPRVAGVAFTGSNEAAWAIQRTLAERRGAIVPLIAETGGINAMIADSTALPEQIVRDAVRSAFDSAGQRCSALRVLCLQEEIAGRTLEMLEGAVRELKIGDPLDYATDIGPVIDEAAQEALQVHKLKLRRQAREIVDLPLPTECTFGSYVTPAIYEIDGVGRLEREVFGPILHVVRYRREQLGALCDAINATGYGLTLGLHSRIESTHALVAERMRVGNLYVNRNQIGATVGVQPFGGEGLSGTGPKAGGPFTLPRYAVERVVTTDLTATGGNLSLLGSGASPKAG